MGQVNRFLVGTDFVDSECTWSISPPGDGIWLKFVHLNVGNTTTLSLHDQDDNSLGVLTGIHVTLTRFNHFRCSEQLFNVYSWRSHSVSETNYSWSDSSFPCCPMGELYAWFEFRILTM